MWPPPLQCVQYRRKVSNITANIAFGITVILFAHWLT